MNTATYHITTATGYETRFTFAEHHRDDDYGNGNYISVTRGERERIGLLDMRYEKYDFETACESFIKRYFGVMLRTYERI